MKEIFNNPAPGVSRPATCLVINLSEEKWWQIKAFKCSYFLYMARQKELMSHYAVPQITPREKNSSPQTAECGGSTPSGELIYRLIGSCGIQWSWLHLPSQGSATSLLVQCRNLWGIFSPNYLFWLVLFSLPAGSITEDFCTSATCLLGAHAGDRRKSWGDIYSISIFTIFPFAM